MQIDIGAQQLIAAERDQEKIAVEIKTFGGLSFINSVHEAVGQYVVYRKALQLSNEERILYLALPEAIYKRFFNELLLKSIVSDLKMNLLIYDENSEKIIQWIQ